MIPPSLAANPSLSTWLRFDAAGHAEVYSGKVELGQGILSALAQIAAEELDLDIAQVRMVAAVTGTSPDESVTSGSLSVQHSGAAVRHVCAQARALCLDAVAARHAVPTDTLHIERGRIHSGDRALASYWDWADTGLLDVDVAETVSVKAHCDYRLVGASTPRDDVAAKVFGKFEFIHDLQLPGMVHGRIVRPPSPAAVLMQCPEAEATAWDGVRHVVRDGSLLGVMASTEALAERAAEKLAAQCTWSESPTLPEAGDIGPWLKSLPHTVLERGHAAPTSAPKAAETTRARFTKPFIRHASIGPSCALAVFDEGTLTVWTHSQGIYNLRKDLGLALELRHESIVVRHVQGAGCYGHNGADDVAFDAAWLACASPGHPVRVQWSREDELCWSPVGPAMLVELEADTDEGGRIVAWRHESWSPGHGLRPGRAPTPTLLGSWYLSRPVDRIDASDAAPAVGGGGDRNADPGYAFPAVAVTCRRTLSLPMRTSALRALGAFANVFAIESFMDELAHAAGCDPVVFRLQHSSDPRAVEVIRAASAMVDWQTRPVPAGEGRGRGIAYARYKNTGAYCAVVAEVDVAERVRVLRLSIAVDVGLAINPDGVCQQIEGGAIQATSWALIESAHFDRVRMLDQGWSDYPILRFSDAPRIDVSVLPRPDSPSLGAGEASLGPTAAAIANAVFDALGIRVRDLPLTPDRIAQAINA
ncbi:MAG: molybdopterin-dependent oxidoreductase [Gammaproteobacteria bacterium]|nr:molybdopterin-dependent oxidoreductase [Gammaproteobacteria bacterium]